MSILELHVAHVKTQKPAQPSLHPLSNQFSSVLAYRNRHVVERMEREFELSTIEATLLFDDTLRFLSLAGHGFRGLAPTPAIDKGWHTFLLFTRDYADFCYEHFGRFVHHEPRRSDAPAAGSDALVLTFELARKTFGPSLSQNWQYVVTSSDCESFKCTSSCSPTTGGGGNECTPD